ncbi:2-dehydropantoate 2-reductase family protein, putative [Talaromyces stipitatus ATCC 10500]|uniref:2-dehydropantoate 2-reductase n=1 Tax=Talaromyces stipitatus (strain ATCC 10500 / CBS 375.48 / QM 6759 / NRRL 1006) TaxID=441959 RepID=B8MDB5_TALSN|nr:2-dehydropantoate 2-reductase family protein, putative [Talaromyces stipitatus ATCC 10500]EED17640.1 2-dehydropantoate 2-reductase family protein, putative [Talaromyces stipitatus ATCC 10500]
MANQTRSEVLLVGCGGVGALCAYNLEVGTQANVTAVLRSNYDAVDKNGFSISSIEHGEVTGWRPSKITRTISGNGKPFDFIVVTTKNIPDQPPAIAEVISPAVTHGHTIIVLLQNGINIERPLFKAFPDNIVLSGVSMISATETEPGKVRQDDPDILIISPFHNPRISMERESAAAQSFVDLYSASGKASCKLEPDVGTIRWRKLIYNACYNSICAILDMDTTTIRYAKHPVNDLVRPAMWEIWHIAKATGHPLPADIVEEMVDIDTWSFFKPSMAQDTSKGNFTEYENIVGEPLREAQRVNVPAPTLTVIYGILKALQWKVRAQNGLIKVPLERPQSLSLLEDS